ncbi:hybrid sensor histidine kinase/response regulator [Chloroflexus sp.]|uniref:hybrid sensor histidine kinase/response regulator n=1 Tax=Chloroflexus sp. TaxID=1904827 RepID=UPI002608BA34|nr:PAS domain S-box protein [uncultured Chloroflexus sp.]
MDIYERLRSLERENAILRQQLSILRAQFTASLAAHDIPFDAVFHQLPIPMVLFAPDGMAVAMNRANEQLVATPIDEVVGNYNIYHDPAAQKHGFVAAFEAARRGQVAAMPPTPYDTAEAELEGRTIDQQFWSETTYFPIYDHMHRLVLIGEMNRDVTDWVRIREEEQHLARELRDREQRLAMLFNQLTPGIAILEESGRILDCNRALGAMLGYERDELIGKMIMHRTHPDDRERDLALWEELLDGKRDSYTLEKRYLHKDGHIIYGRMTCSAVRNEAGKITFLIRLVEDISAQRKAEADLEMGRRLLQDIINQIPALIFVKDAEGRYLMVNERLAHFSGYTPSAMIGKRDDELFPPALADYYVSFDREVIRQRRPIQRDDDRWTADGLTAFTTIKFPLFDHEGRIYGIAGIALDVTERRRMERERERIEQQLRETQRLESLGVMAGGIAHDFNNLLVSVLGNVSLALNELLPDHPAYHLLIQIEQAAQRATELTNQLLTYTGRHQIDMQQLDLARIVEEMQTLLRSLLPRRVDLIVQPSPTPLPIEGNIAQIRQVLMNLAINGAEAITGSGTVTIATDQRDLNEQDMAQMDLGAEQPPGRYAALIVQDTGHGMDDVTKARIFDPFFSTKFTGRGLGLAAVNGIVRAHRGALQIVTVPDQGATFTVFWPLTERVVEPAPSPTESPPQVEPTSSVTIDVARTALIVDDEPDVRRVAERMLRRIGFTVYEASNGEQALQLLEQYSEQITLALIDLTMPGITGDELAAIIVEHYPALRIILMSGFAHQEIPAHLRASGRVSFLAKPFTVATLTSAVTTILSSHAL